MLGDRLGEYPAGRLRKYLERRIRGKYESFPVEGPEPSNELGRMVERLAIEDIQNFSERTLVQEMHSAMTSLGLVSRDQKPRRENLNFKRDWDDNYVSISVVYIADQAAAKCEIVVWDKEPKERHPQP